MENLTDFYSLGKSKKSDLNNENNVNNKNNIKIEIEIIKSSDPSIQCIHALQQVMHFFSSGRGCGFGVGSSLSAMGNDKKAVIAWFTKRYPAEMPVFKFEKE